jgi:hypothetical protein
MNRPNAAIFHEGTASQHSLSAFWQYSRRRRLIAPICEHGEVAGSEKKLDFREQLQLLRSEPLIDVGAIRGPEMNYHLSRFPNSDDYAVIIEFSHAPRDACILTVGKPANGGHQFVVKRMEWYTL